MNNVENAPHLPAYLGIHVLHTSHGEARAELAIQQCHLAPNGYLHAGTVITLADSAAGFGCIASLPEGAINFTTLEIKSNHLSTARDGTLDCSAKAVHVGRTTQVWDATVTHRESGKTLALFRCTQMILYPK